jgi:hypothetical protein
MVDFNSITESLKKVIPGMNPDQESEPRTEKQQRGKFDDDEDDDDEKDDDEDD